MSHPPDGMAPATGHATAHHHTHQTVLLRVLTLDLPDQIANIREVQHAYELVQQLLDTRGAAPPDPLDRRRLASLLRILNVAPAAEVGAATG
ncbi:MAG: hypothetical protein KF686_11600 [Ramlibacter sp.]|nr:hypothetical protein [Ramlibacter sp.]